MTQLSVVFALVRAHFLFPFPQPMLMQTLRNSGNGREAAPEFPQILGGVGLNSRGG
jgi:hypothetical protein